MGKKKIFQEISDDDLEFINNKMNNNENKYTTQVNSAMIFDKATNYKINLKCKNIEQKEFLKSINENDITLCSAKSGVGKTYIAVSRALELLQKDNQYRKIYLIKPAVESEETLGSLPGTLQEKLDPYMLSFYIVMDELIGYEYRKELTNHNIIETLGLGFLRGINLKNCIVIADEMQNSTAVQMKTLLTRISDGCKMIIMGDTKQIDNKRINKKNSGLITVINSLKGIDSIGVVNFKDAKSIRHPLIDIILERLEKEDE
jgi:phosphate starvation-inducible PhoH-like protein